MTWKNLCNSTSPCLVALMLLGLLQTAQADSSAGCDGQLRPYHASYEVYRNGKLIGVSTATLSQDSPGQWLYQVATEATEGMGGLLGGAIHESAQFAEAAGVLTPLHYNLSQKVALSKVTRSADFDWNQMQVSGKNKKKKWQLDLSGDETDRLSAEISIRQQLAAGNTHLSFKTVEKGELIVRDFEALEAETVDTGLGEMLAIPVHRKHENTKRTTITWLAPQLGYLPVRVKHAKQGDSSGKLILQEYQAQPCSEPAGDPVPE